MKQSNLDATEFGDEAQHIAFMNAAIDCAESSCVHGNHPFGAVLSI